MTPDPNEMPYITKIIAIALIACAFLYGIFKLVEVTEPERCTEKKPIFFESELVSTKLGHVHGIVNEAYHYIYGHGDCKYQYRVRLFRERSTTNTHTLSADDPISASDFSEVYFNEYELEAVQ